MSCLRFQNTILRKATLKFLIFSPYPTLRRIFSAKLIQPLSGMNLSKRGQNSCLTGYWTWIRNFYFACPMHFWDFFSETSTLFCYVTSERHHNNAWFDESLEIFLVIFCHVYVKTACNWVISQGASRRGKT